ncbi:hypothetical protein ABZ896_05725 [Streptomyces sp. NPDC047072]|uniref:hypothetical protein n=1 Tax=Streptomyces sp. NPDC047072 TaxID=3154809 RepID=UPI0033F6CA5C
MHFDYELSQIRNAELLRQAEQERLAREVRRGRRAARREAAEGTADGGTSQAFGTGGESHTGRPWRQRFLRTA